MLAQICLHTSLFGRQWLSAQHHPGNTVSYVIIPREVPVVAITIPNNERKDLPPCDEGFGLRFDGTPVEGFEVEFELGTSGQFRFLVVDERSGNPSFPGLLTQPQAGTMTTPGEFCQGMARDFTAIYRNFAIVGSGDE